MSDPLNQSGIFEFIKFECPGCGKHMTTEAKNIGKSARCVKCRMPLDVPGGEPPFPLKLAPYAMTTDDADAFVERHRALVDGRKKDRKHKRISYHAEKFLVGALATGLGFVLYLTVLLILGGSLTNAGLFLGAVYLIGFPIQKLVTKLFDWLTGDQI